MDYLAEEDGDKKADEQATQKQHQATPPAKVSPPTSRFYMGIDGTYVGALGRKKYMEAKVGIVKTSERAEISKGRNLLLNKQYTRTYDSVEPFRNGN